MSAKTCTACGPLSPLTLPAFSKQYGHTLLVPGEWLLKAVAGLAGSILTFAVSVVISGFLFIYGPGLASRTHGVSMSIAGPRGSGFVNLAGATIRNVAQGIIGIAVLQALVIGVALIVAEVPHAGLLTFVTLVLAITQIGTGVTVIPMIIWFWFTKDTTTALLFTLSMIPVGVLEHVDQAHRHEQGTRYTHAGDPDRCLWRDDRLWSARPLPGTHFPGGFL